MEADRAAAQVAAQHEAGRGVIGMSYSEFTLESAQSQLGLCIEEADLFAATADYPLSPEFTAFLKRGVTLALAVNTEKAKSEFIIAPILLEVKQLLNDAVSIFSGIELSVDTARGLNGVCDFVISRSARQHLLTAPVLTVVEAKNDNLRNGLGQCIAEMYAAWQFNQQHQQDVPRIYGVITIGSAWKFLSLEQQTVVLDTQEYFINQPEKLVGIFIGLLTP